MLQGRAEINLQTTCKRVDSRMAWTIDNNNKDNINCQNQEKSNKTMKEGKDYSYIKDNRHILQNMSWLKINTNASLIENKY